MLQLDNVPTTDNYNDCSIASESGSHVVYLIANGSARMQVRGLFDASLGNTPDWTPPEGMLVAPTTAVIDKCSGIRFKSGVPGSPAQVIAQLMEPKDVLPQSGTPFTQKLTASGQVVVATTRILSSASSPLVLSTAFSDAPGSSLTFTVVGNAAVLWVVLRADLDAGGVTGNGAMQAAVNLDGADGGFTCILVDDGPSTRASVMDQWIVGLAAGNHTLKVRGKKANAAGNGILQSTDLVAYLLDQ